MKIQASGDVTSCRLVNSTDVSEERSAFKVSVTTVRMYRLKGRDISEQLDIHQHPC